MKMIVGILLVFVTTLTVYAQEQSHTHKGEILEHIPDLKVEAAGGDIIRVDVNGLVCDFCAQAIDRVFRKHEAVADVAVDLKNKIVEVALKENGVLEDQLLSKMIVDSGYNVVEINRYTASVDTSEER
jgi:copper chaperone CopZ